MSTDVSAYSMVPVNTVLQCGDKVEPVAAWNPVMGSDLCYIRMQANTGLHTNQDTIHPRFAASKTLLVGHTKHRISI